MKGAITDSVSAYLLQRGIIMGTARAEALNEKAPEGFRPGNMLSGAKTVLVFARPLPLAVFLAPETYDNKFYQRAAYTHYLIMDEAANTISSMLERAGCLSLPIPAYSPLRFHEGEPRGIMSLKHAAAEAGLGALGKNSLLIHPEHGNVMRLGALVTTMEWPEYSRTSDFEPCSDSCRACERACPIGAIRDGSVDKVACMGKCIRHTMLPPSFLLPLMKRLVAGSMLMTKFMELMALNFFETYGLGCTACLRACPHFPGNLKMGRAADTEG